MICYALSWSVITSAYMGWGEKVYSARIAKHQSIPYGTNASPQSFQKKGFDWASLLFEQQLEGRSEKIMNNTWNWCNKQKDSVTKSKTVLFKIC